MRDFERDKKEAIDELDQEIAKTQLGGIKKILQNATLLKHTLGKLNFGSNNPYIKHLPPKTRELIKNVDTDNFIKQAGGKTKRKHRRGKKTRRNKSKTARRNRK